MESLIILAVISFFFNIIICSIHAAFNIELIHTHSIKSPFYNATETHTQRLAKILAHAKNRIRHFDKAISTESLQTDLIDNLGLYLIKYHIGTPPIEILGALDTGSDLTWIQCLPCVNCYPQDAPIFNPATSSSFHACHGEGCTYNYGYVDGSKTVGTLAYEKFTLGGIQIFPVRFGCSNYTTGLSFNRKTQGVVGLSHEPSSFIHYLRTSGAIEGLKFSYCLVSYVHGSSSKMTFGTNPFFVGGVRRTPLIMEDDASLSSYYYLSLNAITIVGSPKGNFRVDFFGSQHQVFGIGNMIIDSGSTSTTLPKEFFLRFLLYFQLATLAKRVSHPNHSFYACYNITLPNHRVDIIFNFRDADIRLNQDTHYFARIRDDISCLMFRADEEGQSIYGNWAQTNNFIQYDLDARVLDFKPADCSLVN